MNRMKYNKNLNRKSMINCSKRCYKQTIQQKITLEAHLKPALIFSNKDKQERFVIGSIFLLCSQNSIVVVEISDL